MPLIPSTPNNANTYLPGVQVIPGVLNIVSISNSFPMEVVCVNNPGNTYIEKQLLLLSIPVENGMQQANGLTGSILDIQDALPLIQFSLDIDSTNFDVFTFIAGFVTPATVSPSGSRNLQYNNETNQVAFQDLNNIGN